MVTVFGLVSIGTTFGAYAAPAQASKVCASGREYTITVGETLSGVALRYHANWQQLAQTNDIADPDLVLADQTICVPTHTQNSTTASTQSSNTSSQQLSIVQQARTAHLKFASHRQTIEHKTVRRHKKRQTPAKSMPVQQVVAQPTQAPVQSTVTPTPVPVVPTAPPVVQAPVQPTPTPVVSTGASGSSIDAMISSVFGSYAAGAEQVAMCESGMNPDASNGESISGNHAAGLFQILYPSTWEGTSEAAASPYNAEANIIAAHEIFVRDGYSWREWTCQP